MPTYANNLWIVMNFGHRPDLTRTAPYSSYVSKQFCFPDSWAGIPTSKRNNTIGGHPLVNSQEDKSALTWFWCVAVKSIVCKSIIHNHPIVLSSQPWWNLPFLRGNRSAKTIPGFIAVRPSPQLLEAALIFARSNNFTIRDGASARDGASLLEPRRDHRLKCLFLVTI